MKAINAAVSVAMALALTVSMAACTTRNQGTTSSAPIPSSSVAPSRPSSSPASSEGLVSRFEDTVSDMKSNVESAVTTTMSTDFDKIGALGSEQVIWGPGVEVDKQNRTTAAVGLQKDYSSYGAYFIAPEDCGKFYLTFDEGYENGYTAKILDVLKEKDVQAVFFVTGDYVQREPELIQRMIDEGHTVGNHTWNHWNPATKGAEKAHEDIEKLHNYMLEHFNYEMHLYRPPEGAFSEQTLAMVQSLGYTPVLWSFAYADWDPKKQPGVEVAKARTSKFIHEGAIYLLHAVSHDNAEILGGLIDEVRAKGLEISPWDLPYVAPEE